MEYLNKQGLSHFWNKITSRFVPKTTKINGKNLSSDVTITASDIEGVSPSSHFGQFFLFDGTITGQGYDTSNPVSKSIMHSRHFVNTSDFMYLIVFGRGAGERNKVVGTVAAPASFFYSSTSSAPCNLTWSGYNPGEKITEFVDIIPAFGPQGELLLTTFNVYSSHTRRIMLLQNNYMLHETE